MRYKIEIHAIQEGVRKETDWNRLHDKKEFDSKEDPQYGYVSADLPYGEETKIYEQTSMDNIDLKAVIDAFNKGE